MAVDPNLVNLSRVELLLSDVDGVLTDSTKTYDLEGNVVSKTFYDGDTLGIRIAQRMPGLNLKIALVSGDDRVNSKFAEHMNLPFYHTTYRDKLAFVKHLIEEHGKEKVAYIGNDLNDLNLLQNVGVGIVPKNSMLEDVFKLNRRIPDNIILVPREGGQGCFRQVLEYIFIAKGVSPEDILREVFKV